MGDSREDVRIADDISTAALSCMHRHGVPATPENYAVWYAYCAGTNRDLKAEIDHLLERGTPFTPERSAALHERFFGQPLPSATVEETSLRLEQVMSRVLHMLGEAGRNTTAYGQRLADLSGEIAEGDSLADVQATVKVLLDETRAVLQKNKHLEKRLARSSQVVSVLREDLETMRRDALTDPLTGTANRKQFDQRLHAAAAEAMDSGVPLCLALIDIDHFKQFNDRFGHRVGDQVLRLVAKTLSKQTKGKDTAARYGGEEFALILPETRRHDAMSLIDGIRHRLASSKLASRKTDTDFGRVTVSAGVAQYRSGEPLDQLIRRADMALYAAKNGGRNCVVSEESIAAPAAPGAFDDNVTLLRRPAG